MPNDSRRDHTLSNGVEIPKLGLGTWFIKNGKVDQAVRDAASVGYRHIDTAQAYRNEAGVGEGLRTCGVARSEMFVSPIAHGELLRHEAVVAMAERYGVSAPQLSIRYDLQLGLLPLPKTANVEHMKSNAAVDFVISEQDMATLGSLPRLEDYGDASIMPVFGGKLTFGTMLSMVWRSIRA